MRSLGKYVLAVCSVAVAARVSAAMPGTSVPQSAQTLAVVLVGAFLGARDGLGVGVLSVGWWSRTVSLCRWCIWLATSRRTYGRLSGRVRTRCGDCGLVRGRWTPSPLEDGPGRDDRGPCRHPESRLAAACVVARTRGRIRCWGCPVPLGRPRQVDCRGRRSLCGAVADSTACLNLNKVRLSRSPIRPQIPRVSRGTGPFPGAADSADRPAHGRHQGPLPPAYWPKILHLSFSYSGVPGAALLRKSKLAPSAPTRRFVTDRSRTTLVDQARSFD